MSEPSATRTRAVQLTLGATSFATVVGVVAALGVPWAHRLISGTGALAIALLLTSLACAPTAALVPNGHAVLRVALKQARRWLGLSATLLALVHAMLAMNGYLGGIVLRPILEVPWLRDGGLALTILVALSLTSFPAITRALRVRAWSALHRLVYLGAALAAIHALGAPFGAVSGGVLASLAVLVLLVARPIAWAIRSKRPAPESD